MLFKPYFKVGYSQNAFSLFSIPYRVLHFLAMFFQKQNAQILREILRGFNERFQPAYMSSLVQIV